MCGKRELVEHAKALHCDRGRKRSRVRLWKADPEDQRRPRIQLDPLHSNQEEEKVLGYVDTRTVVGDSSDALEVVVEGL